MKYLTCNASRESVWGRTRPKTVEGEDVDVEDEEGVDAKEEGAMMEIGEEEKEKVVAGKEEGMLEKMIGDYGPQQEVFRKRRSNPPSTA